MLEKFHHFGFWLALPCPSSMPRWVCTRSLVVIDKVLDDETSLILVDSIRKHHTKQVGDMREVLLVNLIWIIQLQKCLNECVCVIKHLVKQIRKFSKDCLT